MPQSKPQDGASGPSIDDRRLALLCEQFIADCQALPQAALAELSLLSGGPEGDPAPIASIESYLKANPTRLRTLVASGLPKMPYHEALKPLDAYSPQLVASEVIEGLIVLLGDIRMHLCILYLHEKAGIDMLVPGKITVAGRGTSITPMPTKEQLDAFVVKFEAINMPLTKVLSHDLTQRALKAEAMLLKREQDEKADAVRRNNAKEREAKEQQRGKERAANEARQEAQASFLKQTKAWEDKQKALEAEIASLKAKLAVAQQAAAVPGVSPAELTKLEADIEKRYRDQLEGWKDETVRPWMVRLEAAEKAYAKAQAGLKLSEDAIRLAREEASKDLLSNWEQEPLRALPLIEARLGEVDQLVAGTLKPSPALVKVHLELRQALDACRAEVARITSDKPKTLMVGAIAATIKELDFDSLKQIAKSINQLGDKGVLTPDESTAISKMVNDEVAARTAEKEHETAPGQLLMRDLVAGKEVDILVDAYNFMHVARQHFAKLAVPSKKDPTKFYFEANARAKLASLVAAIPKKYPNSRVLVFLDGQACETAKPADRVRMIVPTQKTFGEGQADEEIIYYLRGKVRKPETAYVVSADKQVQQSANRHLSVSIFSGILEEIG